MVGLLNRADQPLLHPSGGGARRGVVVALKGHLHQPVGVGAQLASDGGRLGDRVRDGFLDQHGNAAARERDDVARVVLGARRDDHGVDAGLGRHRLRRRSRREIAGEIPGVERREIRARRVECRRQRIAHRHEVDAPGAVQLAPGVAGARGPCGRCRRYRDGAAA